ncbi:MAG: hypothetical protein MRERC_7c047 [Mycoplasmataceae bacterium RC_NB112A]|nr:MAG: hypothetical protein MRERC_8c047 [Mycoplasmataceae bacterium RC_NB112A]KLL01887.1 MAG: hypothetical protein MRERC_7c047 [Mycoplasmataceae bacterium RC_NB112A]
MKEKLSTIIRSKPKEYQEVVNAIEKLNIDLFENGKEFKQLTNLVELNQWANRAVCIINSVESYLLLALWERGKSMKKKITHEKLTKGAKAENKILNLAWPVYIYKAREM